MRRHPEAGVELLAGIEFPWDVRPLIESHHERWDGRGYPDGLIGEAIPLSARVMSIADVYDALRSRRPYKEAYGHDDAVRIIMHGDGRTSPKHFDPRVLSAFVNTRAAMRDIYEEMTDLPHAHAA